MAVIPFMLAIVIKLFTIESPASKKERQKQYDADPSCCLKSKEWYAEHPEGYQKYYDNYIKEVHKEYYKGLAKRLNEKE